MNSPCRKSVLVSLVWLSLAGPSLSQASALKVSITLQDHDGVSAGFRVQATFQNDSEDKEIAVSELKLVLPDSFVAKPRTKKLEFQTDILTVGAKQIRVVQVEVEPVEFRHALPSFVFYHSRPMDLGIEFIETDLDSKRLC